MAAAVVMDVQRVAAPLLDAASLLEALSQATALADRAQACAVALALDDYGNIDLPDVAPATADDQEHLRAIAPLYLASQLEEANLLPAVETLSALAVSGGLPIDLGAAASLIQKFWQQRNERFRPNERRAFFTRLFGADNPESLSRPPGQRPVVNQAFENLMIDLSESLYKLDEHSIGGNYADPQGQVSVCMAARNVAENLLGGGNAMTAFAAKEMLSAIHLAVQILQQPALQHSLGANSLWATVRAVASRYLHTNSDTAAYVERGKCGLTLLSWLADVLPQLNNSQPLVSLDHPVIGAAAAWLEASLSIREAAARAGG
jgi:hypothetical protein